MNDDNDDEALTFEWCSLRLECLRLAVRCNEDHKAEEIVARAKVFMDFLFEGTEPIVDDEQPNRSN